MAARVNVERSSFVLSVGNKTNQLKGPQPKLHLYFLVFYATQNFVFEYNTPTGWSLSTCCRAAWPLQPLSPHPAGRRWRQACLWCHKSSSDNWEGTPGGPERPPAGKACTESPWGQRLAVNQVNEFGHKDNRPTLLIIKGAGRPEECIVRLLMAREFG